MTPSCLIKYLSNLAQAQNQEFFPVGEFECHLLLLRSPSLWDVPVSGKIVSRQVKHGGKGRMESRIHIHETTARHSSVPFLHTPERSLLSSGWCSDVDQVPCLAQTSAHRLRSPPHQQGTHSHCYRTGQHHSDNPICLDRPKANAQSLLRESSRPKHFVRMWDLVHLCIQPSLYTVLEQHTNKLAVR